MALRDLPLRIHLVGLSEDDRTGRHEALRDMQLRHEFLVLHERTDGTIDVSVTYSLLDSSEGHILDDNAYIGACHVTRLARGHEDHHRCAIKRVAGRVSTRGSCIGIDLMKKLRIRNHGEMDAVVAFHADRCLVRRGENALELRVGDTFTRIRADGLSNIQCLI